MSCVAHETLGVTIDQKDRFLAEVAPVYQRFSLHRSCTVGPPAPDRNPREQHQQRYSKQLNHESPLAYMPKA
jgi:hypothetical protein